MRHQFCALLACAATCTLAASNAMAAAAHGVGGLGATADTAIVVKVHSRRRAHDMLHGFGFRRVVFRRQYYDGYDKPVYRFSACRGHRRFRIDVNWYGDIMSKHRVGNCAYGYGRRYEREYDRRQYDSSFDRRRYYD